MLRISYNKRIPGQAEIAPHNLYSEELKRALPKDCFFVSNTIFQKGFLSVCISPTGSLLNTKRDNIYRASTGLTALTSTELWKKIQDLSIEPTSIDSLATSHTAVERPTNGGFSEPSLQLVKAAAQPRSPLSEYTVTRTLDALEHESSPKPGSATPQSSKRIVWTPDMNDLFVKAYNSIVGDVPTPVRILRYMRPYYPALTQKQVQSKLQKYRLRNRAKLSAQLQPQRVKADEVYSMTPSPTPVVEAQAPSSEAQSTNMISSCPAELYPGN